MTTLWILTEEDRGMGETLLAAYLSQDDAIACLRSNEYIEPVEIDWSLTELRKADGVWVIIDQGCGLGTTLVAAYLTEAGAESNSGDHNIEFVQIDQFTNHNLH